jgi:AraC-like DNA-binding protein
MIGLIAWRTVLIIMVIQNFSYLLYSWLRLKTYQKSYETLRASGIPGNFIWLQIWVMSLIMIGFGQAMRSLIGLTQPSSILLGIFLNVAITLYFGTFLLYGFINKTIGRRLTDEEEQESRAIYNPAENDGDNLGEGTDTQTITRVQNRLEYLLSVEKIYLSEDLSIHDLAKKIGYPARKLSAHISKHYGYTFPELINRLRVDQAKRLICDPAFAHIGLTDLGLRSGFNSRASFNLMFKRIAGITPREYRKSAGTVEEPPHSETLSPAPYRET